MSSAVLRLCGLLVAILGGSSLPAAISVERSINEARIIQVASLTAADLVVLDGGFEAGFRQGMVCTVNRSGEALGELLLVDLRPRFATALILDLSPGRSLQTGDSVAVKTVSSRK